jgi:hypothetical protein
MLAVIVYELQRLFDYADNRTLDCINRPILGKGKLGEPNERQ